MVASPLSLFYFWLARWRPLPPTRRVDELGPLGLTMRHLKFVIGRIEAIGNREALVGGRCCGAEIRRGDRTTVVTKSDGVQEIVRHDLMIIFHTMRAYDHEIEVIYPGMTAGIIIPDTLAEELHINWALEGDCPDSPE